MNKVEKNRVELVDEIEVLGTLEKGDSKARVAFAWQGGIYIALVNAKAEEIDLVYELANALYAGKYSWASEEDLNALEGRARKRERSHELSVKNVIGLLHKERHKEFWVVDWYDETGNQAYYVVLVGESDIRGKDLIKRIRVSLNTGGEEFFKRCGDREVSKAKAQGCLGRFDDPVKASCRFKCARRDVYEWFGSLVERRCALEVLEKFGVLV